MKLLALLPVFLISEWAFAENACHVDPNYMQTQNLDDIEAVLINYEECGDDEMLDEARAQWQEHNRGKFAVREKVGDKLLEGSSSDLTFLREMASGRGRHSDDYKKALESCSTVVCVLSKTLGSEESAFRALNIAYKSNYYTALKQVTPDKHLWSLKELRRLDYAVDKMPKSMLDSHSMGRFYTLPNGYNKKNGSPGVGGWASYGRAKSGEIVFRSAIREKKESWPLHIMIHEMAHHYDFDGYKNSLRDSNKSSFEKKYHKLNGWKKTIKKVRGENVTRNITEWNYDPSNSCFPRDYAKESPAEDFAEAVSYYILEPKSYQQRCPKHFAFLKEHFFEGKDFIDRELEKILDEAYPRLIADGCFKKPSKNTLVADVDGYAMIDVDPNSGSYSYSLSPALQVEAGASEECKSRLKDYVYGLEDLQNYKCIERNNPALVYKEMLKRMKKRAGREMAKELEESVGIFEKSRERCFERKNLLESCPLEAFKQSLANSQFDFSELGVKNGHKRKDYDFSKTDINADEVILECYSSSTFALREGSPDKVGWNCDGYVKKRLDQLGFQYEEWQLHNNESFAALLKQSELPHKIHDFMQSHKKEEFQKGCFLNLPKCIRKKLEKELEPIVKDEEKRKRLARNLLKVL